MFYHQQRAALPRERAARYDANAPLSGSLITVIIVRYPSDYGDSILTNLLAPRSGRPEANREAIYVRSHP
jgi:hypothetical protein